MLVETEVAMPAVVVWLAVGNVISLEVNVVEQDGKASLREWRIWVRPWKLHLDRAWLDCRLKQLQGWRQRSGSAAEKKEMKRSKIEMRELHAVE